MEKKCGCGYYPTVIIPGIGQSMVDLLSDEGARVKSAWPLDLDTEAVIKSLISPAVRMLVTRSDKAFCDTLYKVLCRELSPLAATADGIPKAQLRVVTYNYPLSECTKEQKRYIYKMVPMEQLAEVIGEDHLFFFAFHSFGQPYETARELHNFIQMVKQRTGHDRVNLVPVSLGGSIAVAYFDAYGDRCDVHRVMNFVPAVDGSIIASDVFEGRVMSDKPYELFELILGRGDAQRLTKAMRILPSQAAQNIIETVLKAALDTIFLNCPAMWAIIPREHYDALRDRYLCDSKHEALRHKADRYHRAQVNYEQLFKLQQDRGVSFFTVCGYGKHLAEFVLSQEVNSDSIVHLSGASMGAYSAPPGEVLGDSYKQAKSNCGNKYHNHLSPDGAVDAGTCLFPDSTWFFADQIHDDIAYNDVALLICREVLTNEEFTDVYSDPAFPQFNGSRNIRELRYKLIPRACELLQTQLHEHVRKDLEQALEQAQELFTYTVVENNDAARSATDRLAKAVFAAEPELVK